MKTPSPPPPRLQARKRYENRDRMGKQAAQQWDGDHLHLITLSSFLSPTLLVLIHPPLLSTQMATSHYGGPHSGNWSKE